VFYFDGVNVNITVCYEIDVKFWSFMLKMWCKRVFWKRVNFDCDVDDSVTVKFAPHVFLCLRDFKVRVLNSGRVTIFYIAESWEMWPQLWSSCRFGKIMNCRYMFGLMVKWQNHG